MPYYLAPYEKVPVRATVQCQPVGCEGVVRGPIDLRPDGGATLEGGGLNACLLWLPFRSPDWRLTLLAESPDEPLAQATRHYLRSLLWLPEIPGRTFADMALRLMLDPPRDGWTPLRPTRAGLYEVWLGGERIAALPAIRGGTTITETFTGSDLAPLGPNLTWTLLFGATNPVIIGNQAACNGGTEGHARADSDLATDDHYVQAVTGVGHPVGTPYYIGLFTRKDATTAATLYRWTYISVIPGWELAKFVTGTETVLDGTFTTDVTAGQVIRTSADGSTIKALTVGVERASVTDTGITGNLRTGIHLRNTALDTFEAADVAAGSFTLTPVNPGSYAVAGTDTTLQQLSPLTWLRVGR